MADTDALDLLIECLRARLVDGHCGPVTVPDRVAAAAAAIGNQNKVLFLVANALALGSNAMAFELQQGTIIANNVKLLGEIAALSKRLLAENIRFALMKGPVQQKIIYGDYFRKQSSDIDILTTGDEFSRVGQVLIEFGYAVMSPSKWWSMFLGEEHWGRRDPRPVMVDLHRHIHQPGTPGPSNESSFVDDPMIIDINGTPVPTLSKDHMRLLCVISFTKALYNREPSAAYICDLFASLMADVPAAINSFLSFAAARGMAGQSLVALRAMRELFDVWPELASMHEGALRRVSGAQFRRMIFTPQAADLVWPKRRGLVWEYCNRNPAQYAYEVARIGASELTRHTLERAGIARMNKSRASR